MTEKIKSIINKADIKDVGFCSFKKIENHLLDCRAKQRIPKNAKTVISFIFPYKAEQNPPENISRYAAVPDYHKVVGGYLNKICDELKAQMEGYQFEWFVDNSPIPEVYTAALSGLGIVGKNGLLITEKYGSFVFLGEIVTDLELNTENREIKYCIDCGACQKVCPKAENGGACLSALTQKKGKLNDLEKELLKKHRLIWGCDICAEICPLNKNAECTYIKEFLCYYRNCFTVGEDITGRAYEWRGEKTVTRNAIILGEKED